VLKTKVKIFIGVSLFLATIGNVYAEDTLSSLMQKLKSTPTARVAYLETRKMQLMTEPWHGSGYLYSLPPELMIREQLQPQRLLMGIKGNKALYFDPKEDVRHQVDLDGDNELSVPLGMFKALVNADEALLRSLFQVEFSSGAQAWAMTLQPKQKTGSVAKIMVTGLSGQRANKISILQEDGDSSEFILKQESDNGKHNVPINKLYQELLGE
jgi:Outer membrane lipoprotein carrier protein LolA-like